MGKCGVVMNYFYGAMWLAVGLILIFKLNKENKIFYFIGGYFIFLGGWWIANELIPSVNIMEGPWGIALKVISAIVLAIIGVFYYKTYWKPAHGKKK